MALDSGAQDLGRSVAVDAFVGNRAFRRRRVRAARQRNDNSSSSERATGGGARNIPTQYVAGPSQILRVAPEHSAIALDAIVGCTPSLTGKAVTSFATALRAQPVRDKIVGHQLRGEDLTYWLAFVGAAADAA